MSTATKSLTQQLTDMEASNSIFEEALRAEAISTCAVFNGRLQYQLADSYRINNAADMSSLFPKLTQLNGQQVLEAVPADDVSDTKAQRIAVLFSGGPASGGHNVVLGLKHALGEADVLFGVKAGPKGLIEGDLFEISDAAVSQVQNMGGFDFLGSDRTKIKSDAQFAAVRKTVEQFQLTGIVVIGGDDSNTNAAVLAERLLDMNCQVIGVPKTIDGDLQFSNLLPISFGFDTATKIYSELVGNILQDTPSSRKYWHFVKVMGRSASHVALEVALQTKAPVSFVSEEIRDKKMSLNDVVDQIARVVAYRAGHGMNYGVVLIPEGLIEFIPELTDLIQALNDSLASQSGKSHDEKLAVVKGDLNDAQVTLLLSLPDDVQEQLLLDRDSHGNLKVSQIDTDALLMNLTAQKLAEYKADSTLLSEGEFAIDGDAYDRFSASAFSTNRHFFGYEGRCGAPTRFDAVYTYNLGLNAGHLIRAGHTGYIVSMIELGSGGKALAIPLTAMMQVERRDGKDVPVIEKALVELDSPAFEYFASRRVSWAKADVFSSPGPRQLWGPTSQQLPVTVALNQQLGNLGFDFS